jgi:outer membrane protein OmpA-like peptidoglycan-associated protein
MPAHKTHAAAALATGLAAWMVSADALAQPVSGPYVSLGGGGSLLQDQRLTPLDATTPFDKLRFDGGPAAAGALGYGFGNGFRVEVEGDWRQNNLQGVSGAPGATAHDGREQNYGALANVIFDMDVGSSWIYPYFGAGAGWNWTHLEKFNATYAPPGSLAFNSLSGGGTDGRFAFQGLFGVSLPIAYVPGLSFTAEYRFVGVAARTSFAGLQQTEFAERPVRFGTTTNYSHTGLLGLRYELFPPPVPTPAPAAALETPAAPPAPAAARIYLVFFDWDRADLTDRARQIVAEAAQASTHVQTTRIDVSGYTDLSGTAQYNQGLSVRRAKSVEAELVRDGVPAQEIDIHGYGETNPLVPTAKGVREPQNRRVEIVLK